MTCDAESSARIGFIPLTPFAGKWGLVGTKPRGVADGNFPLGSAFGTRCTTSNVRSTGYSRPSSPFRDFSFGRQFPAVNVCEQADLYLLTAELPCASGLMIWS